VVTIASGIGEAGTSIAYVRRHDPAVDGPVKDRYDLVIAISSRCAHVGCPVRYVADAQSFVCPCHGGVYDFRGLRVGGPPPRPLDRFYTLIRAGMVYLGPRYSVNSELRRFSLRDPGEPLDGIGQFLYLARLRRHRRRPARSRERQHSCAEARRPRNWLRHSSELHRRKHAVRASLALLVRAAGGAPAPTAH
jgi:nitrite reductase/ring-hydroxylating ferredoxin subunit